MRISGMINCIKRTLIIFQNDTSAKDFAEGLTSSYGNIFLGFVEKTLVRNQYDEYKIAALINIPFDGR